MQVPLANQVGTLSDAVTELFPLYRCLSDDIYLGRCLRAPLLASLCTLRRTCSVSTRRLYVKDAIALVTDTSYSYRTRAMALMNDRAAALVARGLELHRRGKHRLDTLLLEHGRDLRAFVHEQELNETWAVKTFCRVLLHRSKSTAAVDMGTLVDAAAQRAGEAVREAYDGLQKRLAEQPLATAESLSAEQCMRYIHALNAANVAVAAARDAYPRLKASYVAVTRLRTVGDVQGDVGIEFPSTDAQRAILQRAAEFYSVDLSAVSERLVS